MTAAGTWSLGTNERVTGLAWAPDPGPGLVPGLLLVLLGLGALGLVVRAALSFGRTREQLVRRDAIWALPYLLPAATLLLLIVYSQAMVVVGFVPATAVFASLWSILIAWQEGRRRDVRGIAFFVAEGLAITFFMYFVFERVIGVPLP